MAWPKGVSRKTYNKVITKDKNVDKELDVAIQELQEELGKSAARIQEFGENNINEYQKCVSSIDQVKEQIEVTQVMESEGFYYAKTCSGKKFWIDTNTNTFKLLGDNFSNVSMPTDHNQEA